MDSITTYNCICDKNKTFKLYAYMSKEKFEIDKKKYLKFNLFTEYNYLENPGKYSMYIRFQNDTLFVKSTENYKYFNKLYQMGITSRKTQLFFSEIPFLIFSLNPDMKWKVENDLYLIDSIQLLSNIYIQDVLVNHFKNFDYDTPATHIPFIEAIFVSLENGILGIKYDSGNIVYDCWIE